MNMEAKQVGCSHDPAFIETSNTVASRTKGSEITSAIKTKTQIFASAIKDFFPNCLLSGGAGYFATMNWALTLPSCCVLKASESKDVVGASMLVMVVVAVV